MENATTNKKNKVIKAVLIVLAVVIGLYGILAIFPKGKNFKNENPTRSSGELPILIAHGGGNREFPDNTLEAFYNAYSVDKNVMMETDVNLTADGVIILSHDTTLDRKTNVTGKIIDWTYADLIEQEVNFGYTNPTESGVLVGERELFKDDNGNYRYPSDVTYPEGVSARHATIYYATTLEDLILCFPDNMISVEIKQSGETGFKALEAVLALIEKHDAFDRVVVASFHEEIYDEFCRLAQTEEYADKLMFSPAYAGTIKFFALHVFRLDQFFGDKICVFQLPMEEYGIKLARNSFIKAVHRNNIAIHYWTVNDPEEMRELIELGADGITTDYPHLLAEVYAEYEDR